MQFHYNQLILICLSTTVLFASSWNRGLPPLIAHRRTPPVPYYNRFPLPYQHIPSKQPWPRQDVLPLPQQDNIISSPFSKGIPDPFLGGNYSTPTTLEKPYLLEPVDHDDNSTDMTPDPQEEFLADEKKSKDKNKYKDKYNSEFQPRPPSHFPPPPPIPDLPPILPMFYLVDEPAPYYDYDFDLRYPHHPQQEKPEGGKEKDKEETITLAPFTIADVKIPTPFLRIETMICFTILGLCYGLGFLVLFQSLCVPAAKLATVLVYVLLLKNGLVEPVTLEQAIQQLPPT